MWANSSTSNKFCPYFHKTRCIIVCGIVISLYCTMTYFYYPWTVHEFIQNIFFNTLLCTIYLQMQSPHIIILKATVFFTSSDQNIPDYWRYVLGKLAFLGGRLKPTLYTPARMIKKWKLYSGKSHNRVFNTHAYCMTTGNEC